MTDLRQSIQEAQNFAGLKGHVLEVLDRLEGLAAVVRQHEAKCCQNQPQPVKSK